MDAAFAPLDRGGGPAKAGRGPREGPAKAGRGPG